MHHDLMQPDPQSLAMTETWPDRSPDRGQQIRDLALQMFVEEGFGNVSLRQLAAPLGLHAGSLYQHLESKQTLLFDLIDDHLQNLLDSARWNVAQARDVRGQLIAFVSTHIDFHVRHRSLSLLSNLELRSLEAAQLREIKLLLKNYRSCLSEILSAGMRCGLFRQQHLATATHAVLAMLSSVAFWFDASGQINCAQLTEQLTAMVLGALCI